MARGCPRHSPLKRSAGRRRSPTGCAGAARGEQVVGSSDPRCETVRGTHWPLKVAGVFGTRVAESHLGQRSKRPHQQAGHMDASDPIRPRKLLWHGGRPHMGPGVRRDDHVERYFMTSPKSLSRTAPSTVSADAIVSSLLTVQTSGPGFVDLTAEIAKFAKDAGAREGTVTLFVRHTSASLSVQENADTSG